MLSTSNSRTAMESMSGIVKYYTPTLRTTWKLDEDEPEGLKCGEKQLQEYKNAALRKVVSVLRDILEG
jgi:hypothetical protein